MAVRPQSDQQVGWLEVAMDDALRVGRTQPVKHLPRHSEQFFFRKRAVM
jgi:hypothetical protein